MRKIGKHDKLESKLRLGIEFLNEYFAIDDRTAKNLAMEFLNDSYLLAQELRLENAKNNGN